MQSLCALGWHECGAESCTCVQQKAREMRERFLGGSGLSDACAEAVRTPRRPGTGRPCGTRLFCISVGCSSWVESHPCTMGLSRDTASYHGGLTKTQWMSWAWSGWRCLNFRIMAGALRSGRSAVSQHIDAGAAAPACGPHGWLLAGNLVAAVAMPLSCGH